MTTGRINQVTSSPHASSRPLAPPGREPSRGLHSAYVTPSPSSLALLSPQAAARTLALAAAGATGPPQNADARPSRTPHPSPFFGPTLSQRPCQARRRAPAGRLRPHAMRGRTDKPARRIGDAAANARRTASVPGKGGETQRGGRPLPSPSSPRPPHIVAKWRVLRASQATRFCGAGHRRLADAPDTTYVYVRACVRTHTHMHAHTHTTRASSLILHFCRICTFNAREGRRHADG